MSYTRPPNLASASHPGIVMIGDNVKVSANGAISAVAPPLADIGTWAPRLISGPDGGAIITKTHSAAYFRNEQFIFLTFDIEVAEMQIGNPSSLVMLEGFPFISSTAGSYCGSATISYFKNMNVRCMHLTGSVLPSSYCCDLWFSSADRSSLETLQQGFIRPKTRLQGTVTYLGERLSANDRTGSSD